MSASLPDLFVVLREVMASTWPGRTPRRLIVDTVEGDRLVLPVPLPSAPEITPIGDRVATDEEPRPGDASGWSKLCHDIFLTLEEVGHRLTTTRLLSEMTKRGREWSRRYVERALKMLMDEGALTNDQRAKPPGYWLADLPSPPPSE